MATSIPYVGDIGTIIKINMGEDLTTWDGDKFLYKVKKGDGSTAEWKNVTVEGGSDEGKKTLVYTTVNGDLNVNGSYFINPYGENGQGWKGHGRTVKFKGLPIYE